MSDSLYQQLKAIREEKRLRVKTEPRLLQGVMMPSGAGSFNDTPYEIAREGGEIWMKVGLSTVIEATDTLGWDAWLNIIDKQQRKSKDKGYKGAPQLIERYGIVGDNVMSAVNVMVSHAMGAGFSHHMHTSMTEKEIEAFAGWCVMVDAMQDMGYGQRAQNLNLWCDGFDDLNTQIVNPDIWMIHSHCPLKGDAYCRFYVDELDGPAPGADYAAKVKNLNAAKRAEIEERAPEPDFFQGITSPRFMEQLTPEYIAHDGVLSWGRIAQETFILFAVAVGWERLFEIVAGDQSRGLDKLACKLRTEHQIAGNSVRSAGMTVAYNYLTMGFDDHHIIEFTDQRVEAVGHTCQIVEAAERLEVADKIEDVSLWCDYFHNHAVHGINRDFQLCHTHCLARGDKYCRCLIEEK